MKKIIMFYGRECPHCHAMKKAVGLLEKRDDVMVEMVEVWHSEKNAKRMEKFKGMITKACGGGFGVPALVDEKKRRALCGERKYEELKEWIGG